MRLIFKLLGALVLIVGLGFSVAIWCEQNRIDRATNPGGTNNLAGAFQEPLSPDDSGRYSHDVEVYYGKSGLLLDKATRWLAGLMHGKPLAKTIGVASLVLAGIFFFASAAYHPEGEVRH